ncbi:hypothetical protein N5C70_27350 [Pseudomonas juntendi]|uniref:Uncharacterized protein n=1 Tax=Pseudomonas juntendi TaxID=2666183 RepID=A0ABD4YLL1_9PSED|nr:hypothetical protein [Pseudomonas juntendi]MDH0760381.1 hypothetical protein [Pseudomonas juntendi]MDH1917836.1 hypothetical protein [Pseudomonas juntendi]
MSDHDSSNDYIDPTPGNAGEGSLIFASLFMAAVVVYVVFAAISTAVLNFKAPVSAEDLHNASWLVVPPSLSFICAFFSFMCIMGGALQAFRGSALGLIFIMIGVIGMPTIFPSVSFRSAVLASEAKVGCYDYMSSACTKMLGLPNSSATDQPSKVERKTSAPIEVMAFLRAPFDVFKADQLNQMLNAQRLELKKQLDAYAE